MAKPGEDLKNNVKDTEATVRRIIEDAAFLSDSFSGISGKIQNELNVQLKDASAELKLAGRIIKNDLTGTLRSFNRINNKTVENQEALRRGALKQGDVQKQLNELEKKNLQFYKDVRAAKLKGLSIEEEVLEDVRQRAEEEEAMLRAQLEGAKKIQKTVGATGTLLEGISKIPILGGLVESQEALQAAQEAAADGKGSIETMAVGLKSAGKSMFKNLTDPLTISAGIVTAIADTFKQLDKLSSNTARNFGISNTEAIAVNKELREAGEATGNAFNNVLNLNKALNAVSNQFGTVVDASSKLVTEFNELNKEAGISEEALGGIRNLTELNQKSLKETTAEFRGQIALQKAKTGSTLNEAQILEEIQNTSSAITVSLGGSASAIADAIFKAKSLGVELKDLENISESLLNFQSSIEDELSAELLTGKQLNLEGARYAALMNNQGMLAEELAKNIGTAADYQAMNNIEQQAYAKAVGMSREQLADTLIKREALSKLDAEGNTLQERYNNLLKQGNTEEQIAAQLGDEALARQLAGTSVSEKMAASMDMFKSALLPIAETIMPAISRALEYLTNNMGTVVTIGKALAAVMAGMAASAMVAMAVLNPVGFGIGLAAGLAGIAAMSSATKIGDGDFPARGKAMISTKEGGLFQPSINDDIVVAPGASQALRQGGTQKVENKVSIAPSDTNITLNLNGAAIGNANARQNYGVGKNVKALGGNVDYSASV